MGARGRYLNQLQVVQRDIVLAAPSRHVRAMDVKLDLKMSISAGLFISAGHDLNSISSCRNMNSKPLPATRGLPTSMELNPSTSPLPDLSPVVTLVKTVDPPNEQGLIVPAARDVKAWRSPACNAAPAIEIPGPILKRLSKVSSIPLLWKSEDKIQNTDKEQLLPHRLPPLIAG